jgi:hypothetical protein
MESLDTGEFSVVINFGGGPALTIESSANLRTHAWAAQTPAVTHNQDGTVSTSEALVSLIGQRVLSAVGFKTGALRLVFESGAWLTIPFGEHYEAWQLTGVSGRVWVSLPGGGLATFPGAPT